jgi:hypothetical protein
MEKHPGEVRSPRPQEQRQGATGGDEVEAAVDELRRALRSIRFGSVLVKIHEGRVVAIETSTKLRLGESRS